MPAYPPPMSDIRKNARIKTRNVPDTPRISAGYRESRLYITEIGGVSCDVPATQCYELNILKMEVSHEDFVDPINPYPA